MVKWAGQGGTLSWSRGKKKFLGIWKIKVGMGNGEKYGV